MAEVVANGGISSTYHFKRQLESFCRVERISPDETRRLGKAIIERVHNAHSGNIVFSPSGCKVQVSIKLVNGETVKLLVVFDEIAPGCRNIQKIASARVISRGVGKDDQA